MTLTSEATLRPATNADCEPVRTLVFGILAEYGLAPAPGSTDADLDDIESAYAARGGCFDVLAAAEGAIIGSVGLYPLDDAGACELRKMYLASAYRGQGLGRRLLEHALARARELGFTRVTLETASVLKEAVALYRAYGFRPFEPSHLACRCDEAYELHLDPNEQG